MQQVRNQIQQTQKIYFTIHKFIQQKEWNHKINLLEDILKELNAKVYAIIVKEDEALNQQLEE